MSGKAVLHLSTSITIENSSEYFVSHRIFTFSFFFFNGFARRTDLAAAVILTLWRTLVHKRVADGLREYILKQNNKSPGQETLLLTFGVVY